MTKTERDALVAKMRDPGWIYVHADDIRKWADRLAAMPVSDAEPVAEVSSCVSGEVRWLVDSLARYPNGTKLYAAPPALPDGWQPIETAPKDGTLVWLGKPNSLRLGFWSRHAEQWIDSARAENAGGPRGLTFDPTNWQPIPSAPKVPR